MAAARMKQYIQKWAWNILSLKIRKCLKAHNDGDKETQEPTWKSSQWPKLEQHEQQNNNSIGYNTQNKTRIHVSKLIEISNWISKYTREKWQLFLVEFY